MLIKRYADGIAFYNDDDEIAFYNKFLDTICYTDKVDFETNKSILNIIDEYIKSVTKLEHDLEVEKSKYSRLIDDLCEIICEGEENTATGLKITKDRIKDRINFMAWLDTQD